jgi:hypothetical protein
LILKIRQLLKKMFDQLLNKVNLKVDGMNINLFKKNKRN